MKKIVTALVLCSAFACGVARAQLVDLGNGLINHPAANMTWASDGNLFLTQVTADPTLVNQIIANWSGPLSFGHVLAPSDFNTTNGNMNYWGALAWLNHLNITNYKGYSDWRMPAIGSPLAPGACGGRCYPSTDAEIDSSEWYRLFYRELGGVARVSIHTTHNANYNLFTTIGSGWSNDVYGDLANMFALDGGQGRNYVQVMGGVWPVRTGLSVTNPPPVGYVRLSTYEIEFPPQITLTRSAPRTVTLTNRGVGPSTIISMITTSPIQDDEFVVTHDCPNILPAGASCTASLTFRPQDLYQTRGWVTILTDNLRQQVALTGTGDLGVYLDANAPTATVGSPVTLTWSTSTVQTSGCTASGGTIGDGWPGALTRTGSRTVTATTAGAVEYRLNCNWGSSFSASDSVVVTYTLPTVTISAASTNIQQGASNTLTWTSANATDCTSSGNGVAGQWGGARPLSGSAAVVETTLGMITYTITCTSGTQTGTSSVNVFVNAPPAAPNPPSGGGGGGSLELYTLLAMCMALAVTLNERRRRTTCRR